MAERRPDNPAPATRGQESLTDRAAAAYGPSGSSDAPGSDGSGKPSVGERLGAAFKSTKDKASKQPRSDSSAAPKRVRKAHLRLTHVDPWSVMKVSFLFSVAIGIVVVVAVGLVWGVLGAAGIWDSIDATVVDVVGETGNDFRIQDYLGTSRVMGFTMIVAVVDVVLVTVIGTLCAFLYNLAAALLGGVEVVLAEDER